jgi:hypothetical protein
MCTPELFGSLILKKSAALWSLDSVLCESIFKASSVQAVLLIPYSLDATSSLRTVSGVKRKFCAFLVVSGAFFFLGTQTHYRKISRRVNKNDARKNLLTH